MRRERPSKLSGMWMCVHFHGSTLGDLSESTWCRQSSNRSSSSSGHASLSPRCIHLTGSGYCIWLKYLHSLDYSLTFKQRLNKVILI